MMSLLLGEDTQVLKLAMQQQEWEFKLYSSLIKRKQLVNMINKTFAFIFFDIYINNLNL